MTPRTFTKIAGALDSLSRLIADPGARVMAVGGLGGAGLGGLAGGLAGGDTRSAILGALLGGTAGLGGGAAYNTGHIPEDLGRFFGDPGVRVMLAGGLGAAGLGGAAGGLLGGDKRSAILGALLGGAAGLGGGVAYNMGHLGNPGAPRSVPRKNPTNVSSVAARWRMKPLNQQTPSLMLKQMMEENAWLDARGRPAGQDEPFNRIWPGQPLSIIGPPDVRAIDAMLR